MSTWNTFSLQAAMQGVRVGFQNSTNVFDDTATGVLDKWQSKELTSEGEVVQYRVIIKDITVYCNESGVPYDTTGVAAAFPGYTTSALKLYQPEGASTRDTGAKNVTRAIIGGEDSDGNAVISSLEPRDYYAMHILAHMLRNIAKPDQSDVGNITYFCSAAYRWAQGMMNAAAAARTNIPVAQDEVNMRGASTLDQLVEKLTEAIEGGGGGGGTDPNAVHYYNLENGDVKIDGYLEAQQLNANWLLLWDQDSQYESDPYEHYLSVDNDVLKLDGSPVGGGGGWTPNNGSTVDTVDMADGAVTTAKINSKAVTNAKLNDNVNASYLSFTDACNLGNVVAGVTKGVFNVKRTVERGTGIATHVFYITRMLTSTDPFGSGEYFFVKTGSQTVQGISNPLFYHVKSGSYHLIQQVIVQDGSSYYPVYYVESSTPSSGNGLQRTGSSITVATSNTCIDAAIQSLQAKLLDSISNYVNDSMLFLSESDFDSASLRYYVPLVV